MNVAALEWCGTATATAEQSKTRTTAEQERERSDVQPVRVQLSRDVAEGEERAWIKSTSTSTQFKVGSRAGSTLTALNLEEQSRARAAGTKSPHPRL